MMPAIGSKFECGHFGYTVVAHACATGQSDCPNGDDAITVLADRYARYPHMTQCFPASKVQVPS